MVVGGTGGSGTRVVAEMLRELGVFTGADLNPAGDNKWFTLLGKLPRWNPDPAAVDAESVICSLDLLERAMTGRLGPDRADRRHIASVVRRCVAWSISSPLPDDRPASWLSERAHSLERSRSLVPPEITHWGWKEPNSHLFLEHLRRHFGLRLRYVHVIRDGFYMAQSANQNQVRRWGPAMGVPVSEEPPDPRTCLDYWIRVNELAVERGRQMPSGQFLVVNYDELCASAQPQAARLARFLGLSPTPDELALLARLPRSPREARPVPDELMERFGPDRVARVKELCSVGAE